MSSVYTAYIIAGLVLGSIYALAGLSIAFTFKTTGIFNFALGGIAFFIARCFYQFTIVWHWNKILSGLLAILVLGPVLGVFLWAVLFRRLANSSTIIRIVATIGLLIALPPLAQVIFGISPTLNVVGLGSPRTAFRINGVNVNWNQTVVVVIALALGLALAAVMRFTRLGLVLRASVDSPEMGVVYGINPNAITVGAWAFGSGVSGLVGILIAPSVGLDTDSFNQLVLAAMATVALASLNRLGVAFVAGIAVGIVQELVTKYAPASNLALAGIVPSVPFFILVLVAMWRSLRAKGTGFAMDTVGAPNKRRVAPPNKWISPIALAVLVAVWLIVVPLISTGYWLNTLGIGGAYAIIMMSFVVTTGEIGIVSLCQSIFVGLAAITLAQVETIYHGPFILGLLAGCALVAVIALLLAACSTRLGPIYVALLTLGFGYVVENLVYSQHRINNFDQGTDVQPLYFASRNLDVGKPYFYFVTVVLILVAAFVRLTQRSNLGLRFAAVRGSRLRSSTLGIRNPRMLSVGLALGATIAGLGGGILVLSQGAARPTDYPTLTGIVWFAVAVTLGVRSVLGATLAGITFSVAPALVNIYLPSSLLPLPTIMFGLGAIGLAAEPRGSVVHIGGGIDRLLGKLFGSPTSSARPTPESDPEVISERAMEGAVPNK